MQPQQLDSPRSWLVAVAAMLCLAVAPSTLLVACFGVLTGPLSQEFGWTRGQIGVAISVMAVAIMIVSPFQGVLIDRFGARRVIVASIVPFAAVLALMH